MEFREIIDQVRSEAQSVTTRELPYDVYELALKAELVLRDLGVAEEWSFFLRHVNPIAKTATGRRDYPLPEDFGTNFIKGSDDGRSHVCKILDGSGDKELLYRAPDVFFATDFESVSNGFPSHYTIQSEQGRKRIFLDPPPDSNGSSHYTIRGVYRSTFTNLILDSWIPEEVGSYLIHGVLMKIEPTNPSFFSNFQTARSALYLDEARQRNTRLVAVLGEFPESQDFIQEFL